MRKIGVFLVALALSFGLCLNAFALRGFVIIESFGILYAQGVYFADKYGSFVVLDADKDSALEYTSMISYDDLSGICADINTSGVNCTLHKNITSGVWVIAVNDPYLINSAVGLVGNTDGYVYVAEIDTTGEDTVTLLSDILTRLTLVEHYVKSTFFELWDQGKVLDDIYTAVDSFFENVYDDITGVKLDTSDILTTVATIKDRLYYNGKSAAYYLGSIETYFSTSNGLVKNTNAILNQILEAVEALDSSPTEGGTSDSMTEYEETASGLLGQIQTAVSATNVKLEQTNQYLYSLDTKLDMSTVVENQNTVISYLSDISASMTHNGNSLAKIMALFNNNFLVYNNNFLNRTATMIDNQTAANVHLAQLSTDLAALLDTQEAAALELSDLADSQLTVIDSLSNIEAALINNDRSVSSILSILNNNFLIYNSNFLSKTATMIEHQESILALLQAEGAFTTDLSGVLAELTPMHENLMDISSRLVLWQSWIRDTKSAAEAIATKLTTVLDNQAAVLALMQQEDTSDSDLTGVEDKLDQLIDLLEGMNNTSAENIENNPVDSTHEAYEVFVITDADGNEIKLSGLSGDVLVIGGRLMNFLYKVAFHGALKDVDAAIEDMTDFYISDSVVLSEGGSLWD